jgi:flagellar biosynthetic protein FliP
MRMSRNRLWRCAAASALLIVPMVAGAASPLVDMAGVQVSVADGAGKGEMASAIKILLGLTVLSLAPAILMSMTSFIRIVISLSMLRHALGMQETPPNTVIISLALFLTLFTMAPDCPGHQSQGL